MGAGHYDSVSFRNLDRLAAGTHKRVARHAQGALNQKGDDRPAE